MDNMDNNTDNTDNMDNIFVVVLPSHLFFKTSFWLVLLKKVVLSTADFWHAETPGYHTSLWLLWICRGILSHTNSPWSSGVLDLEVSLLIFIIPQSFLRMLEVRNVYKTGFQGFKLYSLFSIWQLSRQSQGSHIIYILKRMKRLGYPFIIRYYTIRLCKHSPSIIEDENMFAIWLQSNIIFI